MPESLPGQQRDFCSTALARWGADLIVGRAPAGLCVDDPRGAAGTLARRGLAGLAWAAMQRGQAKCDPEMAEGLESVHALQALRGQLALEIADEVEACLHGAGVDFLFFKGISLLRRGLYVAGERRLGDIDLLVHPPDAAEAVKALERVGFVPWTRWTDERLRWVSAFTLERPAQTRDLAIPVDLHWGTAYDRLRTGSPDETRGPAPEDPLWRGADRAARQPSAEAEFALVADHLLKHLRVVTHLPGFADLVRFLARPEPFGKELCEQIAARGLDRRLPRLMDLLAQPLSAPPALFDVLPEGLGPTGRPLPTSLSLDALVLQHRVEAGRGSSLRLRWQMGGDPVADLRDVLWPGRGWLAARYPEVAPGAPARLRHLREVVAWLFGRGVSPLSPNQEPR